MDRLNYITSLLSEYKTIADVGTDHGFVPIKAILDYNLDYAYALDVNEGPLINAKKNIDEKGLNKRIETILSDGLKEFDRVVDAIVIAGMGGSLIKKILNDSLEKAKMANALILSPNKEENVLREFLFTNGFNIVFENIIYDKGHFYEIIKAIPQKPLNYNDLDILYGPFLRKEKSKKFISKWQNKLKVLEYAYLKCADDKKIDLENKINMIKEIL